MRLLLVLVFLCTIPDAVVVPGLKELVIDRYGASPIAAQLFLALNLIGLLAAAPVAARLRRSWSPAKVLIVGAATDAILLALMAAPVGLSWTLTLRALEGLPDALVFGELFALVGAASDPRVRVRRYGVASTTLMLSIGLGIVAGGLAVRASGLSAVYAIGVLSNVSIIALGAALRASIPSRDVPDLPRDSVPSLSRADARPLWPGLTMAFADRATGGAMTSVMPLFLSRLLAADAGERGWLVGLPVVIMAIGAGISAMIASRCGVRRTRHAGAIFYALGLVAVATCPPERQFLVPLLVVIGCAGSALLPTSLAIAARSRRGCEALAAFAAAGGFGQACGLLVPLLLFAGLEPGLDGYRGLLAGFGVFHLATTVAVAGPWFLARFATRPS